MTLTTTVVNKYREPFDVYCGRPSVFGNPFAIGRDGSREQVIEKYRHYFYFKLNSVPGFKAQVLRLQGKRLGCYCKPQACHCDVIAEYLNNLP